jgi:hypothetical protein
MWTAIWLFVSALAVALVAPMVAHSIKLADFRQTWINELRRDVADYIGLCRKWIRAYDAYDSLDVSEQAQRGQKADQITSIANDALVVLWRIKMRINPRDNRYKEADDMFLEALDSLLDPGKIGSGTGDLESRWRSSAETAVNQARELLKREWEVTKQLWPRWLTEGLSSVRQVEHDHHEDEADDCLPSFGKALCLADRRGDRIDQDRTMQAPSSDARPPTAAQTTIVIEKVRSMKVGEANSATIT